MTFDVLCTIYVQHYTVAMTPKTCPIQRDCVWDSVVEKWFRDSVLGGTVVFAISNQTQNAT